MPRKRKHPDAKKRRLASLNVDDVLDRLSKRLKKKVEDHTGHGDELQQSLSATPQPFIAPIEPPLVTGRPMPSVLDSVQDRPRPQDRTKRSVVRYILDSMDEGKTIGDLLPMKEADDLNTDFQPEQFPQMDAETEKELNKIYNEDIRVRALHRELDETVMDGKEIDPKDRPRSPGAGYENEFIHAEIGVRKPRFKAEVHRRMFQKSQSLAGKNDRLSKKEMQLLVHHATDVEKDLMARYDRNSSIDQVKRRMIKARRKKQKEQRKRSSRV